MEREREWGKKKLSKRISDFNDNASCQKTKQHKEKKKKKVKIRSRKKEKVV